MMKIRQVIIALALVLAGGAVAPSLAYAADCGTAEQCVRNGVNQVSSTGASMTVGDIIKIVVGILLFVLGAVCVVMIVIGGIKYATSQGDQTAVSSAKNTILYAVVGLVVAIAAYAIVNFVLLQFGIASAPTSPTLVARSR
jgi:hypothetical protein cdivTM_30108